MSRATARRPGSRATRKAYDAVILDLGLPKLDGLTILKRWRASGMDAPVLILTARDGWRERVEGIDSGADDYLVKPFEIEELLARLRAITRRGVGQRSATLVQGSVEIDTRARSVKRDGVLVSVTPLEYRLLAYLFHHRGRVLSATDLVDHLYDRDLDRDVNAIELLVARVRKKIGAEIIETKRGFGYSVGLTTP